MNILGLHKDPWHNTGACAISGEGISRQIAFLSEERLDRVKDSRAFPHMSTNACMNEVGIDNILQFDAVVLDYIENNSDWRLDQAKRPCSTENYLRTVEPSRIHIVDHHLCHACAAFHTSPFEDAAILIIDGRGSDKQTQSLFVGSGNSVEFVEGTDKIGIGLLYAAMTQHVGFGNLQEGKTMGLAPFGENLEALDYDFKGKFNGIETDYGDFCTDGSYALKQRTEPPVSFDDRARAAFEVQQECEAAMLHLANHARNVTGKKYLCLSGGVALNSVANNVILKSGIFDDVYINPAASDTGIPLGAALYGYHILGRQPREVAEISPYLGPSYNRDRVREAISVFDGFSVVEEDALQAATDMLARNLIVARFEGRSEMGPRALGHRSILMSPLEAGNVDTLNARVKFREPFRPFAPVVKEEYSQDFFAIDRPSPYMLFVPDVLPDKRTVIPAVTHVDGTARVQSVTKERNGNLYDIIDAFHQRTGVPVLLNTSYNVAGEPIVETPEDAIKCFLGTNIDALYLEDLLLIKNGVRGG
ncbi:MAG: carbamoyltransferase [Rhizobiaceae bacterium]